jgi:hypothetical protein
MTNVIEINQILSPPAGYLAGAGVGSKSAKNRLCRLMCGKPWLSGAGRLPSPLRLGW